MEILRIYFTGHRYRSFPLSQKYMEPLLHDVIEAELIRLKQDASKRGMRLVILTSLKDGVEQIAAYYCVKHGIPFKVFIPHKGYATAWSLKLRGVFNWLYSRAQSNKLLNDDSYLPEYWLKKNKYILNSAFGVVAIYNGQRSTITGDVIGLAKKLGKAVSNIMDRIIIPPKKDRKNIDITKNLVTLISCNNVNSTTEDPHER